MKILLITPASAQIVGFRSKLIEKLQADGHQVCAIAFDDESHEEIKRRGVTLFVTGDSNRGLNPFKLLSLKNKYRALIKKIAPDVVMTFMLKPNIYGALAAKAAGVNKIFCMVEGGGDVFINDGFIWKLIRAYVCHMYKKAFKSADKVIFLNRDDKGEFVRRKLVDETRGVVVCGIGLDLQKFAFRPIKNQNVFLMVARMLKTKGVFEYFKAARIVKTKYPQAVFNYLGAEGTVKLDAVKEYIDDGSVNYFGTADDVRPFYEDCSVYVLPSYREGFSVSVMEAEAVGRAVIVSDTNGCRDAVEEGYNGSLTKLRDAEDLAVKMIWFIENPQEVERMGKNARKFAEDNFDSDAINGELSAIVYGER